MTPNTTPTTPPIVVPDTAREMVEETRRRWKSYFPPTHVDLFSGIGGFALAARWAGFETVQFCEIDLFCQKVLAKHWPGVPIHGDVRTFDGEPFRGCGLLTGGFPCQPFSIASRTRRGKSDDRYLWPAMLAVIAQIRPRWIVAENSPELDGMALDDCLTDLEGLGYQTAEPLEIPACAVDTWHRRERVWICAHLDGMGVQPGGRPPGSSQGVHDHANGNGKVAQQAGHDEFCRASTNPNGAGKQRDWSQTVCDQRRVQAQPDRVDEGRRERSIVFEPKLCRDIHGLPNGLDRLRALGNAIVPQVAFPILKAIRDLDMPPPIDYDRIRADTEGGRRPVLGKEREGE